MRPSIRLRHVLGTAPCNLRRCCGVDLLTCKTKVQESRWVMRRMEPVPHIPSDPATSCLARADRPWYPTSSSLSDRCSQRPYYRFYYGNLRTIVGVRTHLSDHRTSPASASSGHTDDELPKAPVVGLELGNNMTWAGQRP
jgi:hypothetical protein